MVVMIGKSMARDSEYPGMWFNIYDVTHCDWENEDYDDLDLYDDKLGSFERPQGRGAVWYDAHGEDRGLMRLDGRHKQYNQLRLAIRDYYTGQGHTVVYEGGRSIYFPESKSYYSVGG